MTVRNNENRVQRSRVVVSKHSDQLLCHIVIMAIQGGQHVKLVQPWPLVASSQVLSHVSEPLSLHGLRRTSICSTSQL